MSPSRWLGTAAALVALAVGGVWLLQMAGRANLAIATQAASVQSHTSTADQLAVERGPTGVVLHFDRGANPSALASGWSGSEPGLGVWSDGHKAILRLEGLPTDHPAHLSFDLQPFLAPSLPVQEIDVRAKDRVLAHWRLTKPGFQPVRLDVPTESQTSPGVVRLEFDLPDADTPQRRAPGSHDIRTLGINLKSVAIPD